MVMPNLSRWCQEISKLKKKYRCAMVAHCLPTISPTFSAYHTLFVSNFDMIFFMPVFMRVEIVNILVLKFGPTACLAQFYRYDWYESS